MLVVSLSLGGCATAPAGGTQLSWPVGRTYTVQPGDTVSEIADEYCLSEDALVQYNGLDNRNRIYVGQVLRIPRNSDVARNTPRYHRAHPVYVAHRSPSPRPGGKVYERRAPKAPQRVEVAQRYPGHLQFIWPLDGNVISPFGATASGGRNDGINISAQYGEPIRAAASGTVSYAGSDLRNYGNLVLLQHHNHYVTAYAHAERLTVKQGEHVVRGQVIGYAGTTGDVDRPQLHFEIRHGVEPVNPRPLLLASNASS